MQHRLYQTKVHDDEIKQHICGLEQSVISDAINEWHKCIRACRPICAIIGGDLSILFDQEHTYANL